MDILAIISGLIGGLGLFLYGMKLMGDGLENAAGERLKSIIEKVTSNRFIGVLVGAFVTAIIQSSSATTVMVVSFVNAGLMNLIQAAGIIMGANVGTTITAQMVSFDLEGIAPLVIGIGVIVTLVAKKKKTRDVAGILLGFGILFLGMGMMSNAMKPIADSEIFKQFVFLVGNNIFLGILAGLVMTAVVQSSSATTGILIALATAGAIQLNVALPIILGCNIGTCVTALLAAVGANKTAKKAAIIHLLFNIIGTVIFIPFIGMLVNIVQTMSPDSVARQVANAHTIFNITVTLVLLPFANLLVVLANKILPGEDKVEKKGTLYLDDKLLETPVIASVQAEKETLRMAKKAKENFELSMRAFKNNTEKDADKVIKDEDIIDMLEREIADYLVKISQAELSEEVNNDVTSNFHVISDLERIGDHAKNIAELALEKIHGKIEYDEDETQDLNIMYNTTLEVVEMAFYAYENKDAEGIKALAKLESAIDAMEKELRNNHIKRLSGKKASAYGSVIFLDIISNLERIGDHAVNIAEVISNK
ncbi:MAG: Na/Pi cotransporter family protein [Clostridium sp.]|uniref:Na/Pi cotransporter family protein n=1 Tax=Clostridium sp. TaxID=1506 RepID=UPI002FC83499